MRGFGSRLPSAQATRGFLGRHPGGRVYFGQARQPAVPEDVVSGNVPGVVPGLAYHRVLPPDLEPWHVYTELGGHQLMIWPAGIRFPAHDPAAFLVLVPVRTVLRAGWRTERHDRLRRSVRAWSRLQPGGHRALSRRAVA